MEIQPFPTTSEIKKIGVLRALNLGDSLCIIPAVRAVRDAYPHASITLIGLPWQKKFATRFSRYFNNFISFPGWPGLPEQEFSSVKVIDFLQKIQHIQFDLILQMQGNGTFTNPMCMLLGAKKVAGLREVGKYCPDKKYFPVFKENENEILQFLHLVKEALAISAENSALEFPVTGEEHLGFEKIMKQLHLLPERYICIHPGARNPLRRWSPKKFAAVGDTMAEAGYSILITGSEEERKITRTVNEYMRSSAIDLVEECGSVGLGELSLLVKNSVAVIANDTGISHIAAAMNTPSVVIFTPYSNPQRWAPLDKKSHRYIPAQHAANPHNVLDAVCKILQIKPEFINN